MDFYEDRRGYNHEPLGDYAWKLLALIKAKRFKLVVSDLLMKELEIHYSVEKIRGMMALFSDVIEKVISTEKERKEAIKIAKEKQLPFGDALHAIIARDNNLVLVTRDRHFRALEEICKHYRPEELI